MTTSIAPTPANEPNPVDITIEVTKFQDVLARGTSDGGRDTSYAMTMPQKDPRAHIQDENIYIKRPGAPLRFSVTSADVSKERYFPVGIAFVRDGACSGGDEQRLGLLNFLEKNTRTEGRKLLITDSYNEQVKCRYKFSVVIQRGSDGAIGIIDPGIIHEDD